MKSVTYILTLVKTGIFYIGSTSNLYKRLSQHIIPLTNNSHKNYKLQQAWNIDCEYFVNSFEFDDRKSAYDFEEQLILKVDKSERRDLMANICLSASFGDSLTRHPFKNEIINKRINSQKETNSKLSSEERMKRFSKPGNLNGMFGRTHTPEVRRKLSEMMKGHSFNKGIKLKPAHIAKISERQKLRVGEKNSFYGKHHSEETKEILRKRFLGVKPTNCRKISANGIIFNSCADASRNFNISQGLVTHRLKNNKYKDWFYLS
jgi:group I intron endonuclease